MTYGRASPHRRTAAHARTWNGRYAENHSGGLFYELTAEAPFPASRLTVQQEDALARAGVTRDAINNPLPLASCRGHCDHRWMLEVDRDGPQWIAIPAGWDDWIFWNHSSGEYAFCFRQWFALGQERIRDGGNVELFATPIEWLIAGRKGIVIIDWHQANKRLRDCASIAYPKALEKLFWKHMPAVLPKAYLRVEA